MAEIEAAAEGPFGDGMGNPALRSGASGDFEAAWREACHGHAIPLRKDIGLKPFARFAPWMAIIEPDKEKPVLPYRLVGSGFFDFFGADLTGMDYLSLVDPAIAQDAYDSVRALMAKPCGLWQFTPVVEANGRRTDYEYTIFPLARGEGEADQILVYVHIDLTPADAMPEVQMFEGAAVWRWIDIGYGIPPLTSPFF